MAKHREEQNQKRENDAVPSSDQSGDERVPAKKTNESRRGNRDEDRRARERFDAEGGSQMHGGKPRPPSEL